MIAAYHLFDAGYRSVKTKPLLWLGGFLLLLGGVMQWLAQSPPLPDDPKQKWTAELQSELKKNEPSQSIIRNWRSCASARVEWAACFSDLPKDQNHLIWNQKTNQWVYWTNTAWPVFQLDSAEIWTSRWSVHPVQNEIWVIYGAKIDDFVHFHGWELAKLWSNPLSISLDSVGSTEAQISLKELQRSLYVSRDETRKAAFHHWGINLIYLGFFFGVIFVFFALKRYFQTYIFSILGSILLSGIGLATVWILEGNWSQKWARIIGKNEPIDAGIDVNEWIFGVAVLTFLWVSTPHILKWVKPAIRKKLSAAGQALLIFLSLIVTFYLTVATLHFSIMEQMSLSHSDELLQWNSDNLFWYASIVLFVTVLFVMSYRLQKTVLRLRLPLGKKLLMLLAAGIVFLPFFLLFPLDIHPFAFFILSFIIIILMDLFAENVSGGLTWPFIWLTVLAACTSLLVFTFSTLRLEHNQTELLRSWMQEDKMAMEESKAFSWAKYQDERLVFQRGPLWGIPSAPHLDWSEGKLEHFQTNQGFYVVGEKAGTTYVIGRQKMGMNEPISLYAFFFVLWVLVALCLLMINRPLNLLPRDWAFFWSALPSLRKRIQFYILAVTVGSFVTIAWVTYLYFEYQGREQAEQLALHMTSAMVQDLSQSWETKEEVDMQRLFQSIQDQHQTSGSLYSRNGVRLSGNGAPLLPLTIRKPTYFSGQNVGIQQGQIYHKIIGPNEVVAIAQFDAETESLNVGPAFRQIIMTLLNIYVFLFVLTGGIAVAISNSITAPLKVLSERLKSLKLGRKNIPLEWSQKDELGELIRDYNRMIMQLEESAKILATTERETAWREMAKQVAHEIKNPLTPMKLSLQHLQFAIENDSPNKEKLFRKVSATLIEQIDNLNRIASEFSTFAKMPEPENKVVSLNEVVASIHDLFRERKDMDIKLFVPIDDLRVFADKDHLLRVMSNLIKNAIQAIPEDRRGLITIKLFKKGDEAVVLVADNGKGIPDDLKEKVFKPNFTSKSSGTGLGLAICANIIEGFNGKIYFETVVNKGTDFYVVIPLMRTKENFYQRERVTL